MLQMEYTVQTGRWVLPGVGTCIQTHTSYILSAAELEASAEGRELRQDPALPKGAQQPLNFRPMSIVTKRSLTSATAELL